MTVEDTSFEKVPSRSFSLHCATSTLRTASICLYREVPKSSWQVSRHFAPWERPEGTWKEWWLHNSLFPVSCLTSKMLTLGVTLDFRGVSAKHWKYSPVSKRVTKWFVDSKPHPHSQLGGFRHQWSHQLWNECVSHQPGTLGHSLFLTYAFTVFPGKYRFLCTA